VHLVEHALTAVRTWKDIHIVELRRVRDGSPLKSLQTLSAFVVTGTENAAPVLDFTRLQNATVDAQRSSRSRNALHRHERKIGALGVLCYELLTEPERECEALLRAAALKRVWTREKGLMSSGNAHPASLGCLLEFAHRGKLTVAQLLVGDRVAAIEIGIVERGCYWSLVQSYDFDFAKYGPGRLLFHHLLELCPGLGIERFDFLAPATRHKTEWSNVEIPVCDFLVPTSIAGSAATFYLAHAKPSLRQIASRLSRPVRQKAGRLVGTLS